MRRSISTSFRRTIAGIAVGGIVIGGLVAFAAPAGAATNPTPVAGARRNATRLPFSVSGTASFSVDVATGNVLFTDQLITLPGVASSVPVQVWFNSSVFGTSTPSAVTGSTGSGWGITGFDQRLVANSDSSVTYFGVGGLSGVFTPSDATHYSAPMQFQAELLKTTTGRTLTDHASQTKLTFNSGGRLISSTDRNGNVTSFNYTAGLPKSIVSSRAVDRTLTIGLAGSRIVSLTQSDSASSRSVTFTYDSNGTFLDMIQDVVNGSTKVLGADDGQVTAIVNPSGATSTISYSGGKATSVSQTNASGVGTSTTRLQYNSGQTLVADPTTNQGSAVSAVRHTNYTLTSDGSQLVASATDPNGHGRSATYTTLGQLKTSTPAAGGTTSYAYDANSNESLTAVATPGGATSSAQYGNTGPNAYLPSSTTDDANNQIKYSYDGVGNPTSTAQGAGPQAQVAYNSNGTAKTSTAPGASVSTSYGPTTARGI
jgi:YD repeat-containing protein